MCFESGLKNFIVIYHWTQYDGCLWYKFLREKKLEEKYNATEDNVSPHFQYTEQKIIDGFWLG